MEPQPDLFPRRDVHVETSDGKYRYLLHRQWSGAPCSSLDDIAEERGKRSGHILFVGINPSSANQTQDDPTLRRMKTFAFDHGFNGLLVVNLYARRTTSPRDLLELPFRERIGEQNDQFIRVASESSKRVVAAWGSDPLVAYRAKEVLRILLELHRKVWCLSKTSDGHPRHPLYVKREQRLEVLVTRDTFAADAREERSDA